MLKKDRGRGLGGGGNVKKKKNLGTARGGRRAGGNGEHSEGCRYMSVPYL